MPSVHIERPHFHPHHLLSQETRHRIYNTVMTLYVMVTVAVYISISVTKIIAYENFFYYLHEDWWHVVMLTTAIAFIVYVLVFAHVQKRTVLKKGHWESKRMVVEHSGVCFCCRYSRNHL